MSLVTTGKYSPNPTVLRIVGWDPYVPYSFITPSVKHQLQHQRAEGYKHLYGCWRHNAPTCKTIFILLTSWSPLTVPHGPTHFARRMLRTCTAECHISSLFEYKTKSEPNSTQKFVHNVPPQVLTRKPSH